MLAIRLVALQKSKGGVRPIAIGERTAVLTAVAKRCPQLFAFVNWAYAPPAELWVHGGTNGHERLWSTTGVRQGDPMGPLLFALGLQEHLETIASDFPDVRVLAYLDDVYLQGPTDAVHNSFSRFSHLCQSIGLDMATEKCEVWSRCSSEDAQVLSDKLGMKFAAEGFVAAGCPLGSEDFVQSHANSAADKVVQLIHRVLELPLSAQDKLLLLRRSLQLKILHLSRVAHKSDVLGAISKVEHEILAGIVHIIKCSDQASTARRAARTLFGN
jgi:hypothetical protein